MKPNTFWEFLSTSIMQSKIPVRACARPQPFRNDWFSWHICLSPLIQCQDSSEFTERWGWSRSGLLAPSSAPGRFPSLCGVWLEYWHGMCHIITEHIVALMSLYLSPWFFKSGKGSEICISDKLPDDANAAGPWTTCWIPRLFITRIIPSNNLPLCEHYLVEWWKWCYRSWKDL